ncbi:hypothetical protein B0H10DRAFT_1783292, partial [Mycena sp. CBHHK59/15]
KRPGSDTISCYLCGTHCKLSSMQNHVGHHLLLALRGKNDPKPCSVQELGADPCGFCGREGCYTQLIKKEDEPVVIVSNCDYHYAKMLYKAATKCTKNSPCTNVPIHCPLCKKSASGAPRTIWKYNVIYHLFSEHSPDNKLPEIPPQLMIDTFIRRQEEEYMGIATEETNAYREVNEIPDSDGIEMMIEAQKRGRDRSGTESSAGSDFHRSKQLRQG